MRTGRRGKHLLSSGDEDSGDNDDDEPPREKQSVDVWLPSAPPNFRDHVWGGHLDEQMQGAVLPADAKTAIEKQVNEFHLERMNASGKVNSLLLLGRCFLMLSYSCPSGASMPLCAS